MPTPSKHRSTSEVAALMRRLLATASTIASCCEASKSDTIGLKLLLVNLDIELYDLRRCSAGGP